MLIQIKIVMQRATIKWFDLIDSYRTLQSITAEYTFFESAHRTFTKVDHILGHKMSLSKFKGIQFVPNMFSGHNEIEVEINNRKLSGKSPNIWKVNHTLLNNPCVK